MNLPGLAILLAIGFTIAWALAVWFVVYRISRPPKKTAAWALAKSRPSDPGELDTPLAFRAYALSLGSKGRDREYPVWEIEGSDPDGPAVILTPGWGDSRIGMLSRIDIFAAHASTIVAWDPPGHGDAPGRWTMGVHEPAMLLRIADLMRQTTGKRCVLFGSSAGAGVSVATAALDAERDERSRTVCGVLAEAPYRLPWVPARNVMKLASYPWALNGPSAFALMGVREGIGPFWRGFDRAGLAERAQTPVLVIHGSEDAVCPLDDGKTIAARAGGECVVVEGAGHNDLWSEPSFREVCAHGTSGFFAALRERG